VCPIHQTDDDSLANDEVESLILEVERTHVAASHVAVGNASTLSKLNHRLTEVASGQLQGRIACPQYVQQNTVSTANFKQTTGLLN
jgi:hypothetical protein